MATWMTHFRIADFYIDELTKYGIDIPNFIFANIAPDCGILNEDRLTYTPSKEISHFGHSGGRDFKKYITMYLSDKSDIP